MTDLPVAVDLRVDGRLDPIGLDELRARLSWRVELGHPATQRASFGVEVAGAPSLAPATVVWSRSDGASGDTAVVYDGPAPGSREPRFWRVRVVDDRGSDGPWSSPASWEMGLLAPDDWVGRWIGWIDPALP